MLVKSFPRYLWLSLHRNGICTMMYSDKIWEECKRTLRIRILNITDTRIVEIYEDIVTSIGEGIVLNTAQHEQEIEKLYLQDSKDRHVLYLASISESQYLVTYNLRHFQQKDISHKANKRLRFHPTFEVISCDRFLCTLIQKYPKKISSSCSRNDSPYAKKRSSKNFAQFSCERQMPRCLRYIGSPHWGNRRTRDANKKNALKNRAARCPPAPRLPNGELPCQQEEFWKECGELEQYL